MNDEIENTLHREGIVHASLFKRAIAAVIDELLLSLILLMALWDQFSAGMNPEETIILVNTFVLEYMMMKIIYQAFFVMHYGASIGKLAMKIKVIELKTMSNPNVLSALSRAIFRVISELIFYLGFLWGMLNPSRQTWHDLTGKTLVVNA